MIDYETYCKIRDWHERQHLSIAQTARALGLNAQTVGKWVQRSAYRARHSVPRGIRLDPFKARVVPSAYGHVPSSSSAPKKETELPFTPFHMGAALFVKPWLNRNFSVMTFGIAQVAMDIEPSVGMLTGAEVLHGPTHTILGALVIASLVMLIAPSVCSYLLTKWNKEVIHYKWPRLVLSKAVPKTAVIVGAFFGTLSHVALDSLMHHDIQPLLPFSQANPLMGLITHDGVYQACEIAGVLGTIAWFALRWGHAKRPVH